MSPTANTRTLADPRRVLAQIFADIVGRGDYGNAADLVDDDLVVERGGLSSLSRAVGGATRDFLHPDRASGRQNFLTVVSTLRLAFPDLTVDVTHTARDGDRLGARWELAGTHSGPFLGIAATDRRISWTEVGILEFRAGRLARLWGLCDELAVAAALGVRLADAPDPAEQ